MRPSRRCRTPPARSECMRAQPFRPRLRDVCLALWRVGDPGNVGTLLRTADAFGACVALSDGLCRPAVAEGAARVGGRRLPCAGRGVGRGAGPTRRACRPRGCSADGAGPRAPADLRARVRARRSAARCSSRTVVWRLFGCRARPNRSTSRPPARSRSTSCRVAAQSGRLAEAAAPAASAASAAAREAASATSRAGRGRRERRAEAGREVADRERRGAGAEVAAG